MSDQQLSRNEFEPSSSVNQMEDVWRREISNRVDRYRTRRGRRVEGAYSMRFPFPPAVETPPAQPSAMVEDQLSTSCEAAGVVDGKFSESPVSLAAFTEALELVEKKIAAPPRELKTAETASSPDAAVNAPNEVPAEAPHECDAPRRERERLLPRVAPMPRPPTQRKVIAFPRHLMAVPDVAYRLADPVTTDQPRILDVPEELEAVSATPFLDGLTFDGKAAPQPGLPEYVELPFRPVAAARRGYAVLVDALLVAAASGIFGAVAYKLIPRLTMGKTVLAAGAIIPLVLWFVYQYLLLVYGGTTPGLRAAKVRLSTFAGTPPKMRQRRYRVLGLCLSTASLAMGLLWAFVDVDALCWHDRMSQTYLTSS